MVPSRNPQELPTREANIFRKMGRCYENRQFKKALAYAKDIMQTCPTHGETLSMRGLMLASLNKRAEAKDFILAGLKQNLKSFVCWQVFGYFQRLEGNYGDAVKAYRNALKWEKDNLTILRDLASLEAQTRDFIGYKDSKYKILMAKPGQRLSWIGYAIACHLAGDVDLSLMVLREFDKIEQTTSTLVNNETSQLLLYENQLLCEVGRFADALDHIEKHSDRLIDVILRLEAKAKILFSLERYAEASETFEELLTQNPQHQNYSEMLVQCAEKQGNEVLETLGRLVEKHPRSSCLKRYLLEKCNGLAYETHILPMIKKLLEKGTPAVFRTVFVDEPTKANSFERSLLELADCFEKDRPNPISLLWAWYTLAEFYVYRKEMSKALTFANRVLLHTPTFVDGYLLKARILKKLGAVNEACHWVIDAQSLDTADKFINSKCTRYLLRCNAIETAELMIGKFLKVESSSTLDYLFEIQCFWYILECANAYYRRGEHRLALKCCKDVLMHYSKYKDDNEFDFHTYCLRKATISSYLDTLRFDDTVFNNRHYIRASILATQVYLLLNDRRIDFCDIENSNVQSRSGTSLKSNNRSDPSNKKHSNKLKVSGDTNPGDNKSEPSDVKKSQCCITEDSHKHCISTECGSKCMIVEDPLGDAMKVVVPLLTSHCIDSNVIQLSFEIFIRKRLLIPALRCLVLSKPHVVLLNVNLLRFQHVFNTQMDLSEVVRDVILTILKNEFRTGCLQSNIEIESSLSSIASNSSSLIAQLAALKSLWLINVPFYNDISCAFMDSIENETFEPNLDVQGCEDVYRELDIYGLLNPNQLSRCREIFGHHFNESDFFNKRDLLAGFDAINSTELDDMLIMRLK